MNSQKLKSLGLKPLNGTHVSTITPTMAEKMLSANTHNRPIDPNTLERYVGAMERGEWRFNGRTIVFSSNGVLLDGQHTLTACYLSDVTIQALVVYGAAPDSQSTMDAGKKRSFADALSLDGEKSCALTASVTRLVWNWEQTGRLAGQNASSQPTVQQLYDCLERHPVIRESVSFSEGCRTGFMTRSTLAALHYGFTLRTNQGQDVDAFFRRLAEGTELAGNSPIYLLRKRLEDDRLTSRGGAKLSTHTKFALAIKAFNSYMRGDTMKVLRWSGGGAMPEAFPEIEGYSIG